MGLILMSYLRKHTRFQSGNRCQDPWAFGPEIPRVGTGRAQLQVYSHEQRFLQFNPNTAFSGNRHLQRGPAHFTRLIGRDWMSHREVNVTQQHLKALPVPAPFKLSQPSSLWSQPCGGMGMYKTQKCPVSKLRCNRGAVRAQQEGGIKFSQTV